jgi:hypothetical protein
VQTDVLAHLDGLPSDSRSELEASGVFTKIYEDTVKNAFSALESFLGQVFRCHVNNATQVLANKGNIFQRLNAASALYQTYLGFALNQLDPEAWRMLLDGAAMRHLLTHANGIVDERYLQSVPTSSLGLGQRLSVGKSEANAVLESAMRLADAVLTQLP